ncbi:hypothetical protein QE152_g7661 [Popillia japonica]|uniref:Uncharacterized protein n=1 Tax=Popillia japonica TaxID=7064 RepID=A0AAW1MF38_POPJA
MENGKKKSAKSATTEPTGIHIKAEAETCSQNIDVAVKEAVIKVESVTPNETGKKTENLTKQVRVSDNNAEDITETKEIKCEPVEEDVPESFFDDLMSEDFIEGLNVVDTWEGDDVNQSSHTTDTIDKDVPVSRSSLSSNDKSKNNLKSNDTKMEKKKKNYKKSKEKPRRSTSKNRELRRTKRSRSRSRNRKTGDGNTRRDPNKTHRDILRDKDKCEKDKSAKILHEKLKVVETGLVPPGMEMEVDMVRSEKINKLEEGEIIADVEDETEKKASSTKSMEKKQSIDRKWPERSIEEKKASSTKSMEKKQSIDRKWPERSIERKRENKHPRIEYTRLSPPRIRRDISPEIRRDTRRIRSRSPRRRSSPRNRSRSIERRIERRRRSLSRSLSKERKRKYKSPPRKTSPLIKRDNLAPLRQTPPRNIHQELLNASMPPGLHNIPHMNNPQNFITQANVELDQQFFIGQATFEPSYSAPPSNPLMEQNTLQPPLIPPNMQHNFQQNWIVEQPPNYFHPGHMFNPEPNNFQASMGPPMGFVDNVGVNMLPHQQPAQFPVEDSAPPPIVTKEDEEKVFARLLEENKITLSDYLSVTAKATDNSHPVDIQNKIKVISHCQDALSEINGTTKMSGKFLLRKSQKCPIKPSSAEGLSPFKKVPAIKFQYTTSTKQLEDKPYLSSSLNRLLYRLGKEALFQEIHLPSTPINSKQIDSKEPQKIVKKTASISTQTDPPPVSDFGCQVTMEDVSSPSPTKSATKQQSLAKLTPAQLLAQAERESSPPPAPKWIPPLMRNQRNDANFRDFDDMDRRATYNQESAGWTIPGRNFVNTNNAFYNRSPEDLNHLYYGNRH